MKLSNDLITILKNFADINANLTIEQGNVIKTIHNAMTIYAEAQIDEVFPCQFGIYDLKEFLATISMFKNPDVTMTPEKCHIVDEDDASIKTNYYSANVAILTKVPKLKDFPQPDVEFDITNTNFKRIERASSTLNCLDIVFKGKQGKIVAEVCDLSEATKNNFTVTLDENYTGHDFDVHVKQDKLVMIDGDYHCSVIANKILQCVHKDKNIKYVITLNVDNK